MQLIPTRADFPDLFNQFGPYRGLISSVGVAGTLRPRLMDLLHGEKISRVCKAGEMQAPPLGWQNDNVDLFAELLALSHKK